jgi:hypothetical protein
MKTKFYEFSQNNSGGSFVTDSNLCHILIIEASSSEEASNIAEDLGCYWNGVEEGSDCPCCGDRWYNYPDFIDLEKINTQWKGYEYSKWIDNKEKPEEALERIKSRYPKSEWLDEPKIESKYGSKRVIGRMKMNSIEEYAQVMADLYGWTKPDIRIFYKNGEAKEIFKDGGC